MSKMIEINELRELLFQAHDMLHKEDYKNAHELLHKALGVDNDAPAGVKPLAHRTGFDNSFRTACRKNGVRAAYVLIDDIDEYGRARLISGGDARLCGVLNQAVRGKL